MCHKCETKPVYQFTNKRQVCKNCYVKWFEKKVLYTIRKFNLLDNGDVVAYKKSKNFRDAVLEHVLKMISSKGRISIITSTKSKKANKIALSNTTDLEAKLFIDNIINKKTNKQNTPKYKNQIKPLYLFLDKEILLYAKIKRLKHSPAKQNKNNIVDELEKKHPELKRAIMNSYLKIYNQ